MPEMRHIPPRLVILLILLVPGMAPAQVVGGEMDSSEVILNDPEYERLLEELYGDEETETAEGSSIIAPESDMGVKRTVSRTERGLLENG